MYAILIFECILLNNNFDVPLSAICAIGDLFSFFRSQKLYTTYSILFFFFFLNTRTPVYACLKKATKV